MRNVSASLIVGVWLGCVVQADMGMIRYDGYTLSMQDNSDIRMVSEDVHLYIGVPLHMQTGDANGLIGDRLRVTARFDMLNETDKPITVFVGFPVSAPDERLTQSIYDFRVTINDANALQGIKKLRVDAYPPGSRMILYNPHPVWYGWDQTFPAGHTIVQVEYHAAAAEMRGEPAWRFVSYILDTGACWKGAISRGDVTVHFGEPVSRERLWQEYLPGDSRIEGNTIHWRFTDLEPTFEDNIHLAYLPHATWHELQRREENVRTNPQEEVHAVRLAELYFSLGHYMGLAGDWLPGPMTKSEYDAIVTKIADANDRVTFERFWEPTDDVRRYDEQQKRFVSQAGYYPADESGRARVAPVWRIRHIMGSAGYASTPSSPYVAKAKDLLDRLLEKNPRNADAWVAYIENCHYFVYGAGVPGDVRWCPLAPRQKAIIAKAYAQCPADERIRAWYDFATSPAADIHSPPPTAAFVALQSRLQKARPAR